MPTIASHPALASFTARLAAAVIVGLRCIFFAVLILALDRFADLGTSVTAMAGAAIAGTLAASFLVFSNLTTLGYAAGLLCAGLLYRAVSAVLMVIFPGSENSSFGLFALQQHCDLLFLAFALTSFSSWLFWRYTQAVSFEILLLTMGCVYILAGHRNYRFDTPAIINDLAWSFGVGHLTMLILLGLGTLFLTVSYLFFATLPARPVARINHPTVVIKHGKPQPVARLLAILSFAAIVGLVSNQIYRHYSITAATRTANGVGQASQEGLSPLGFHSALGSTNQPAALVRLEGDYSSNPFTPMLYMRESALSAFNGHELVLAGKDYDSDVARTRPEESYDSDQDETLKARTNLTQSVFLLADHESAFAVDYPIALRRLKNPDPGKFRSSYRAYSIAPSFPQEELAGTAVGDPRWSAEQLQHYTQPHADPRYRELAEQIAGEITDPVLKMRAIVQYLSKNAIYTLTPNHDVPSGSDPVAPFLFGDKRGYCVHFAHATVYMARALGIPARIGTGYLTDLSQAKDGHILLRMSDRHAWAEIYVSAYGWIPFDTQPEQVESHAETPVDMKLLEELMGILGPGEEILPQDTAKDEAALQPIPEYYIPDGRHVLLPLLLLAALLVFAKLYVRYSWMLPSAYARTTARRYRSLISILYDLGQRRLPGETRSEFCARMANNAGVCLSNATQALDSVKYAPSGVSASASADFESDFESVRKLPLWKRWLGLANPASAVALLMRAKW